MSKKAVINIYLLGYRSNFSIVTNLAESEGIELDGTYTGKAMAAIINQFKDHSKRNEVTLFWNTYNAIDFLGTIKEIDYHQLPQPFHCYFEEDV